MAFQALDEKQVTTLPPRSTLASYSCHEACPQWYAETTASRPSNSKVRSELSLIMPTFHCSYKLQQRVSLSCGTVPCFPHPACQPHPKIQPPSSSSTTPQSSKTPSKLELHTAYKPSTSHNRKHHGHQGHADYNTVCNKVLSTTVGSSPRPRILGYRGEFRLRQASRAMVDFRFPPPSFFTPVSSTKTLKKESPCCCVLETVQLTCVRVCGLTLARRGVFWLFCISWPYSLHCFVL